MQIIKIIYFCYIKLQHIYERFFILNWIFCKTTESLSLCLGMKPLGSSVQGMEDFLEGHFTLLVGLPAQIQISQASKFQIPISIKR